MDPGARSHRGSVGKRLAASSYLLELVPDQQTVEGRRHRTYSDSLYQLPGRAEEQRVQKQADIHSSSLHGWGGRLEDRLPVGASTKCRLSRSKRRHLSPTDQISTTAVTTESMQDNVIFAESPLTPGIPIVYRTPEERAVNPDRLNLDRRHLTVCPILEGEERLRLLNLQHNSITRPQHLGGLRRLVFLDFYDNLIQDMSGVEGLLSLRVLMLGKNRIRKITGLSTLVRLDVLDLHGNMIRDIENISHLGHLRVLNLAGNEITCVANLAGLHALAELNLRRNRITHVFEVDQLPSLQRLFLSHNLIQSVRDLECLSRCSTLNELTLDGNPVANTPDYRLSIIFHVHCVRTLDQTAVMENERQLALASIKEEEERQTEMRRKALMQEHKVAAVAAIQKAWESAHKDLRSNALSSISTHSFAGKTKRGKGHILKASSLPRLLPTYFIDISPPSLHLYGPGALETLDCPLHDNQALTEVCCHYIEIAELAPWLTKIPQACPAMDTLSLHCTNITTLDQLNALATLTSPLHTLTISPQGNPITQHSLFTPYTVYRLQHLQITTLNGSSVTEKDMANGAKLFGPLAQLTTSRVQPARLASFVLHHRPRSVYRGSKTMSLVDGRRMEESLDKVSLHFHSEDKDMAHQTRHTAAQSFSTALLDATLTSHKKLSLLQQAWPDILSSLLQQTLQDYSQLDNTMAATLDLL